MYDVCISAHNARVITRSHDVVTNSGTSHLYRRCHRRRLLPRHLMDTSLSPRKSSCTWFRAVTQRDLDAPRLTRPGQDLGAVMCAH